MKFTPSVCQSSANICFEFREPAEPVGAKSAIADTFELDTPNES